MFLVGAMTVSLCLWSLYITYFIQSNSCFFSLPVFTWEGRVQGPIKRVDIWSRYYVSRKVVQGFRQSHRKWVLSYSSTDTGFFQYKWVVHRNEKNCMWSSWMKPPVSFNVRIRSPRSSPLLRENRLSALRWSVHCISIRPGSLLIAAA